MSTVENLATREVDPYADPYGDHDAYAAYAFPTTEDEKVDDVFNVNEEEEEEEEETPFPDGNSELGNYQTTTRSYEAPYEAYQHPAHTLQHSHHGLTQMASTAQSEWLSTLEPDRTYKIPLSKLGLNGRLPIAVTVQAHSPKCHHFAIKLELTGSVNSTLTSDLTKGTTLYCGEMCTQFVNYFPLILAQKEKAVFDVPKDDVVDYQQKHLMVTHNTAPLLNIDELTSTSNPYLGKGNVEMMQVPVSFTDVFRYVLEERNHVLPPGQIAKSRDRNNPDYFLIKKDLFVATVDLYKQRDGEHAKTKQSLQDLNLLVKCVNIGQTHEKEGPTVMFGIRF